jgi:translocator protein
MFDRESWISLMPFIVVCFAAASVGSFITNTSVNTWYAQLRKPDWTPPNWIFGPVWTTQYVLMAVSAWLVWRTTEWSVAKSALILFGIQVALNTLWTLLFFGLREVRLAFVEIMLLWMMVVATVVSFLPLSRLAAWLLLPYLLWIGFASYLNFRIWQIN